MFEIILADNSHTGLIGALLEKLFAEVEHHMTKETIEANYTEIEDYGAHVVLLAFDGDGDPAGIITLAETVALFAGGKVGVINELYVLPEYRSEGVGRMLLEAAKEIAASNEWRRLEVTTPGEEFIRTRQFYEREGFFEIGPRYKLAL